MTDAKKSDTRDKKNVNEVNYELNIKIIFDFFFVSSFFVLFFFFAFL